MSEPAPSRQPDVQEPSMEDILASIRRILAEDPATGEEGAAPAPVPRSAEDEEEPEAEPTPLRAVRSADPETASREQTAPPPPRGRWEEPQDIIEEQPVPPTPQPGSPNIRGGTLAEPEDLFRDEAPVRRHDDVFVLQPSMRARSHTLVSEEPAAGSTDVLSQLARAILDRRDIAVGARNVTLEGMVREMLRPLLHEWLDRNLPYLIERLVKTEIDLMINRAERLED